MEKTSQWESNTLCTLNDTKSVKELIKTLNLKTVLKLNKMKTLAAIINEEVITKKTILTFSLKISP